MVIIKVALLPHLLRPRQRRYKEKKIQGLQAYSVERLSKSLNKLTHAQSTGALHRCPVPLTGFWLCGPGGTPGLM